MTCHLCGGEAKYQNKQGKWLCDTSANRCPTVRAKNSKGLKIAHLVGKMNPNALGEEERIKSRESLENRLSSLPFEQQSWERQRNTVITEQDEKCLSCGISEWLGQKLKLQVDHIDGDNTNNKRENLRALCPNCHSCTETFCGKNINNGKKKVEDSVLLEMIKQNLSNRQILLKVGLSPKGGNYERLNKLRNVSQPQRRNDEV